MKFALIVSLLCLSFAGCTHKVVAPVPGSINQFDSDSYLTLITAKATIDQTKADLASGVFTGAVASAVKTAVNGAVTAYNAMDTAFLVYHTAALNGTATSAQQAAVTASSSGLTAAVSSIATAKGAH